MLTGILILCFGLFPSDEVKVLREQYLSAALDKNQIEDLARSCATFKNSSLSTSHGYCLMIHFLEAKNAFNPYKKLAAFSMGKKKLDSLILDHSKNIELRYLRHTIQDRVPGFLGYHDNLKEDEGYMRTNLKTVNDSSTYHLIYSYLENRDQ